MGLFSSTKLVCDHCKKTKKFTRQSGGMCKNNHLICEQCLVKRSLLSFFNPITYLRPSTYLGDLYGYQGKCPICKKSLKEIGSKRLSALKQHRKTS